MARYRLQGPDGSSYEMTAPDDATQEQVFAAFQKATSQKRDISKLESAGRGAIQGATFGFGDEIYGGVAGAYDALTSDKTFSDAYAERAESARAANKEAQEANPWSYGIGEVAGGIAIPGGAAAAGLRGATRAGATLGQRVAQGSRVGAGYGAAYGVGNADPGQDASAGEALGARAIGGAVGAAAGSVVGAAAVPAIEAASAVGRGLTAPLRAYMDPRGTAASKVLEALNRDQKDEGRLATRVYNALQADADVMIADAGGKSTQRLMRSAQNQQNPRTERFNLALDQRQRQQSQKIERGLWRGTNLDERDLYDTTENLVARMDEIGRSVIQPTLERDVAITPRLQAVLERPRMRGLIEQVDNALRNEGAQPGRQTRMQALHRIKVEIDNQIDAAQRAVATGLDRTARTDARELTILRRHLLNAIDNPEYKAALQQYAEPARLNRAAERGADEFLTAPWQEVRNTLGQMSAAERALYRKGAVTALMEKIGSGGILNDKTRGPLGNDNMMSRVRVLFDDQRQFREFQKLLVVMARQSKTRAAAQGNSTTAQQLSDGADAGQTAEALRAASNVATGRFGQVMDYAGRQASKFSGMTPEVAGETLRILGSRPGRIGSQTPIDGSDRAVLMLMTPELRAAYRQATTAAARRAILEEAATVGALAPQ